MAALKWNYTHQKRIVLYIVNSHNCQMEPQWTEAVCLLKSGPEAIKQGKAIAFMSCLCIPPKHLADHCDDQGVALVGTL